MKRRLVLGVSLAAALAAAQTPNIPESAYRRGMPDVLVPAPAAPAAGRTFDRAAFAAAYARAGRPAVAVLWNREFTDMLQQASAQQVRIDTVRAGAASRDTVHAPGLVSTEATGAVVGSTTVTTQQVRSQQSQRAAPVERIDLEMRSAFVQALVASGLRLVDRNVVMRTTAVKATGTPDSQQVETEALVKHAKLIMEVLNTRDASSPTGWATFVSIKRLADGIVVAEGYMNGQEPSDAPRPAPRFVADPNGGFREVVATRTLADVARTVAEQTLTRLAGAL